MKEKIAAFSKTLSPLLAAALVAVCAAVSLSGYEEPIYADASGDASGNASVGTADESGDASGDAVQGDFDLADGVYLGTANGYNGEITVSVQIRNRTIIAINVISYEDDAAYFRLGQSVIDSIIAAQSLDVDTVSGATYSSNGIIKAVRNALYGEEDSDEVGSTQEGTTAVSGSSTTVSTVTDASEYEDGTYYGTGTGYGGTIKVKVVISGGEISSITIVSHNDGDAYISAASAVIDAILAAQSTNVDTVSGATYSSVGIINAVRDALSQAGGSSDSSDSSDSSTGSSSSSSSSSSGSSSGSSSSGSGSSGSGSGSSAAVETVEDADGYEDGTYYGTAAGFEGDITVKVVIKNGVIKSIKITEYTDGDDYISAASAVIDAILAAQSTNVDTVSGATYSSVGIINAVRNALSQAETSGSTSDDSSSDESSSGSSSSGSSSGSSSSDSSSSGSTGITGTVPYTEGIYYGTAEGYGGDITVTVVIQDETIKAILVLEASDEDETFLNRAMAVVTSMVESQSTDVDTVSGATYSSQGLINAVKEALADAERVTNGEAAQNNPYTSGSSDDDADSGSDGSTDAGDSDDSGTDTGSGSDSSTGTDADSGSDSGTDTDVNSGSDSETDAGDSDGSGTDTGSDDDDADSASSVFTDGTYEVTGVWVYPDDNLDFTSYKMTVSFTFADDLITAVAAEQTSGTTAKKNQNKSYISDALNGWGSCSGLIAQIAALTTDQLSSGSYDLDTVSGATCSSEAIIGALADAIAAAEN